MIIWYHSIVVSFSAQWGGGEDGRFCSQVLVLYQGSGLFLRKDRHSFLRGPQMQTLDIFIFIFIHSPMNSYPDIIPS